MTVTANDTLDLFGGWNPGWRPHGAQYRRKKVLDGGLQNLVPTDASPRPACWPNASTFFPNFGTESEASALKFARSATGRTEILYCDHAFHRAG